MISMDEEPILSTARWHCLIPKPGYAAVVVILPLASNMHSKCGIAMPRRARLMVLCCGAFNGTCTQHHQMNQRRL